MTTDDLIAAVNQRAALAPTQNVWTPAQITSAINEEMWSHVVPMLLNANQDFFTDSQDVALVNNQSAYTYPVRSIGSTLRAIKYLDTNNNEGTPLAMIEVADIGKYNITTANAPIGVYLTATDINLLPTPANGTVGSLRMYYPRRPGQMVQNLIVSSQTTTVGTVLSVAYAAPNTTITLTQNTNGFLANTTIDITASTSPYKLKAKDIATTTAAAGTATVLVPNLDLTSYPYSVAKGDYVTLALQSWVPQGIPLEWHSLIELRVASRILDSLGDLEGGKSIHERAHQMVQRLLEVVQPRSSGNPKKINAWR